MTCNEVHDCEFGFGLWNVEVTMSEDDLGPIERPGEEPADNAWYDATTANRETHFGATDVIELIWRYRDLDYDGTTPLPAFDMPDALIDPMPSCGPCLEPYYDFSDYSATCGYPYRSDDDSIALALLEFELKFARWLNSDIAYSNSYADYIYKIYFWSKVNDTPGLNEYLEDDYAAMYETISTTNIPDFYNYQSSIQSDAFEFDVSTMVSLDNILEEAPLNILQIAALEKTDLVLKSDIDKSDILMLAESDAKENGKAVFIAQALLDTIIAYPIGYSIEERVMSSIHKNLYIIYPNPAENKFYVQSLVSSEIQISLEIFNNQCKSLAKYKLINEMQPIDIDEFQSGIYYINIVDLGGNQFRNILIVTH
ncbi:MAG: T9SS type A sorting domain-containing protein [Chitinophagales bacterium]